VPEKWLHAHVSMLAAEIGDRHVRRPQALHAAADYIRSQRSAQGHEFMSCAFQVDGICSKKP
jgi:hypothetical protein